jgi:two-component system chemotaxis response regulator CheB
VFVLVASAGGHEAIAEVLEGVGRDSPHAFIVAIKASDGPSMLEETLELRTWLRIVRVDSLASLRPGAVYIAPSDSVLIASESSVAAQARDAGGDAIDRVLESVAQCWGERATVVVLSGGAAPVQAGARAVLDAGGAVYCQSPSTAAMQEMPASVLRDVGATSVGSPEEIGVWIRDGLSPDVRDTGDPERRDVPLPPAVWTLLGGSFSEAAPWDVQRSTRTSSERSPINAKSVSWAHAS